MSKITTSVNNGHTHTLNDSVVTGQTSEPIGGDDTHVHKYSIDNKGDVTIDVAQGHTHTAARVKMDRKTLSVPLEIKQIDEDDGFFRFKGLLSTFDGRDLGGDEIAPRAFDDSLVRLKNGARQIPGLPGARKILPILWQHDMQEPLGSFIEVDSTDRGLEVEGVMPRNDSLVRDRVIPQMRVGSITDMSIGYIPVKTSALHGGGRLLESIDLLEGSLVTIGMNQGAKVESFKSVAHKDLPLAGRDRTWDSSAAQKRVQEAVDSKGYGDAFLWSDAVDGHKLPFADVIDGELRAVPRGVFAAAAVVSGAKGGGDIPLADRDGVIRNIDRYYDKMGLESPFTEKGFRIDDLEVLDERTLEKTLKSGVVLPGEIAKTVISALKVLKRDVDKTAKRDADLSASVKARFDEINKLLLSR